MDQTPPANVDIVTISSGHSSADTVDRLKALLAKKGFRLFAHIGALLGPIPVAAFSLILQQRSVSGSPTGSPEAIETMLDFASRHHVAPDRPSTFR